MSLLPCLLSTASLPRLPLTGWERLGIQISPTLQGFSLATYPFLQVIPSFFSSATQAFPAGYVVNLTKLFSFPAVHKALNSSQQQAGGASLLLGRHLEKNPHKLSSHLPCLESGSLFQSQKFI